MVSNRCATYAVLTGATSCSYSIEHAWVS